MMKRENITDLELVDGVYVPAVDIHVRTAMEMFGCAAEQVTDDMRKQAKSRNFGYIHGGSRAQMEEFVRAHLMPNNITNAVFPREVVEKAYVWPTRNNH